MWDIQDSGQPTAPLLDVGLMRCQCHHLNVSHVPLQQALCAPRTCLSSNLKSSAFQWALAQVHRWAPWYNPEDCEHVLHLCVGVFCFVLFWKGAEESKAGVLCFNWSSGNSCFSYLHSARICSLDGAQPSPYLGMFLYFQGGVSVWDSYLAKMGSGCPSWLVWFGVLSV